MELVIELRVDPENTGVIHDLPDHMLQLGLQQGKKPRTYSCSISSPGKAKDVIDAFFDHFKRINVLEYFIGIKISFKSVWFGG